MAIVYKRLGKYLSQQARTNVWFIQVLIYYGGSNPVTLLPAL